MYLKDIRLAAFDFDDTLAIHPTKEGEYVGDYCLDAFLNINFYDTKEPCKVDPEMVKLVNYFRNQNIPMYCVSGMQHSLHMPSKEKFIKKHYGNDIRMVCAATQTKKSEVLRILAEAYRIPPKKLFFIDDNSTKANEGIPHLCRWREEFVLKNIIAKQIIIMV